MAAKSKEAHYIHFKPITPRPSLPDLLESGATPPDDDPMDATMSQSQTSYNTMNTIRQQEQLRRNERHDTAAGSDPPQSQGVSPMTGQQARVVQTAFVQKLYNMLESDANQKAISWSPAGDSFIVNPGTEFQNVLASYFKHTNPQSFVRQLNMYGFHKVNDVFQGSSPETHLWEFKHGEGNFRRGDVHGLREIKRRPSRHHLAIHRENHHPAVPQIQPAPMPTPGASSDPMAARLEMMEQHIWECQTRLGRADEAHANSAARIQQLQDKCQHLTEALVTSQKNSRDITSLILAILPDVNNQSHRDALSLQNEIDRQAEQLRSQEMASSRHPSVASSTFDGQGAISPFGLYDDPSRRGSLARNHVLRPAPLNHSTAPSPRPLGHFPGSFFPPPQGPIQHLPPLPAQSSYPQPPSVADSSPYASLSRRHTSADVRESPGWKSAYNSSEHLPLPHMNATGSSGQQSPYTSSNTSAQWPSSPHHRPSQAAEQLRESLGRYQIDSRNASTASNATIVQDSLSRRQSETTPTAAFAQPINAHAGPFGSIQEGPMFSSRPLFNASVWGPGPGSAGSTRRSSMAHILNPADTVERDEEDEIAPDDRGKRKRLD